MPALRASSSRATTGSTSQRDRSPSEKADFHRVDGPHRSPNSPDRTAEPDSPTRADANEWLGLHAADLIQNLQQRAAELDLREAQVNAAIAQLDLRERQFRVYREQSQSDLRCRQQAIEAVGQQLRAHARRLAFQIG